jgi:predicted nucleotidyltransferase
MNLPEAVEQGLVELKQALAGVYGERLKGIYLYGSYARGDFTADSDVDLLIALEGQVKPTREIDGLSGIVADICLRHDLLISVYPVPAEWLVERKSPVFENIRREGVRL